MYTWWRWLAARHSPRSRGRSQSAPPSPQTGRWSSSAPAGAGGRGGEPAVGGRGTWLHSGNTGCGRAPRVQLQCGRSGRPCSSTSEGRGDSGGSYQPGKERSRKRVLGQFILKQEKEPEAPGESGGKKGEA